MTKILAATLGSGICVFILLSLSIGKALNIIYPGFNPVSTVSLSNGLATWRNSDQLTWIHWNTCEGPESPRLCLEAISNKFEFIAGISFGGIADVELLNPLLIFRLDALKSGASDMTGTFIATADSVRWGWRECFADLKSAKNLRFRVEGMKVFGEPIGMVSLVNSPVRTNDNAVRWPITLGTLGEGFFEYTSGGEISLSTAKDIVIWRSRFPSCLGSEETSQ